MGQATGQEHFPEGQINALDMKFTTTVILFTLLTSGVMGQSKTWKEFILPGYVMMDTATGDLTGDGKRDMILILKVHSEKNFDESLRPLMILKGDEKGSFIMIARNDSTVLCAGCGGAMGDPYQRIVIKGRYFSIEHYGGSRERWTRTITFRYDTRKTIFILHRDAGETFDATEDDKKFKPVLYLPKDFGKIPFTEYSNEKVMR